MRVSNHANMRMRERTKLNHNERKALFRCALYKGKSLQNIKDSDVKKFIESKCGKCKIKLYNDYVFIYSKNNKTLYTMYKLPNELLGKEKYRK